MIALGLAVLAVGISWPIISRIGLGRLPGDIVIHRGDATSLSSPASSSASC
jgi:hypothetical protein